MTCMGNVIFILQNLRFLARKKLFVSFLMIQLSDLYLYDAYSSILSLEFGRMRNGVLYPLDPLAQPVRFQSNCWLSDTGQDTFYFRHRFRHADFYDLLRVFNVVDITLPDPFLRMRVGRDQHQSFFPSDVCFMIFLRRMAYPSRYSDLVNEYNIPSMRIREIFHATLSWVFSKFAYRLLQPARYCGYIQLFADALTRFGSPFPNLVGIIDGSFMDLFRPMELGNWRANKIFKNGTTVERRKRMARNFLLSSFQTAWFVFMDLVMAAPMIAVI
jgi:hypothetical protein